MKESSPLQHAPGLPRRRASRATQDPARPVARRLRQAGGATVVALLLAGTGSAAAATPTAGGMTAGARPAAKPAAAARTQAVTRTTIKAVQRKLGLKADGAVGPRTRKAIRRYQKAKGLKVDGAIGPQLLGSLGLAVPAAAPATATASDTGEVARVLAAIADCESGGNPTAVSASGQYRGKYQFDQATWESMGGTGDPAAAPEAEQDRIAALLYQAQGLKPWPTCSQQVSGVD